MKWLAAFCALLGIVLACGELPTTRTAQAQLESCTCETPYFYFDALESTEPEVGWLVAGGTSHDVFNQTFFIGHNPKRQGADAEKPQLGLVGELRWKGSSTAGPVAEWYGVWTHDDGTQFRPIGFVGDYDTKTVLNSLSGETYFLDEGSPPTFLARVARSGAIISAGGSSRGFFAQGTDRGVLYAERQGYGFQPVVTTQNGSELRLAGWGSWTKTVCSGPWQFDSTLSIGTLNVGSKLAELEQRIAALESP